MKTNLTIALIFVWLLLIVSAGAISAKVGFSLASSAIKGIGQTSLNSNKKLLPDQQSSSLKKESKIVDEKAILLRTQNYIETQTKELKSLANQTQAAQQPNSQDEEKDKSTEESKFPLVVQNKGVTLEVVHALEQGGSFWLDINLKNDTPQPINFLYSYLEMRDDQGRAVSGYIDGLPEKLPANQAKYSGTVRIPMALLKETKYISLNLTDYPNQDIQLKIPEIPLER